MELPGAPLQISTLGAPSSTGTVFFELCLDEALREISPTLGNGLPFVRSSDKIKRLSISNTSNVEGFLFLRKNRIWRKKVGRVATLLIDIM